MSDATELVDLKLHLSARAEGFSAFDFAEVVAKIDAAMHAIRAEGFESGQRALRVRMAKYYDASANPDEWKASLSNAILNFPIIEEPK